MKAQGLHFPKGRIVKGHGLSIKLSRGERVRTAMGVPQAVVRVISYARGNGVARSVDYIDRKGELELETESGERIKGREEAKALVKTWSRDFDTRKDSRDSVHITFSMPRGSNPEALRKAVRKVIQRSFPGHEAVFAIHQDKPHPHAHAVVKMRSWETGKKLRLNKPELFKLRETFAEAAREEGVPLTASPRAARGVGTKGMSYAIYQLRKKGIKPEVDKQAWQELVKEGQTGRLEVKPWERAMDKRDAMEREAYREEANSLRIDAAKTPDPEKRELFSVTASHLDYFARVMPKPKTRRQKWIEKVLSRAKSAQQSQGRGGGLER